MLTTSGWQEIRRLRLVAVDDEGHPDSVERCARLLGTTSVYPLDMYLGIDNLPFKATADEALRIARAGATSPSYRDAARLLEDDFGVRLSDVFVREVTEYVGEIVLWEDRRLAELAVAAHDPSAIRSSKRGRRPKGGYTLFAEADGAMLNELQDEGGTAWKEGKLGVVFRSDELVESGTDANGAPKRRIGRREYVCTTEGADVLRARMLRAMRDNGLGDASFVVVIGDGAKWIRRMRDELVPKGKFVLDLYHLKENAMEFAQHIHGGDRSLYYPWWKSVCAELEAGDWRKVLARPEVAEYREKNTPDNVCNLYRYLWANRDAVDYPAYRERGWFVGSGAIESGNKTVMQERMKRAGMQWRESSAETLLALRCKIRSGLWESHVAPLVRERYRTHHLEPGNVREAQRRAHSKKSAG